MEHRFDWIAKSIAGAITRREALWRMGKAMGITALAAVGLGATQAENCAHCTTICRTLDPPPRGHEMAICVTNCRETGVAISPTGQQSNVCLQICTEDPTIP